MLAPLCVAALLAVGLTLAASVPRGGSTAVSPGVRGASRSPDAVAGRPSAVRTPPGPPGPEVRAAAGPVSLPAEGFASWALLDRRTGTLVGSANLTAPSDTMSMIKVWIVADFLRQTAERGAEPTGADLDRLSTVIRDSDNEAAEQTFHTIGQAESIARMITLCGLTDSAAYGGWWSNTVISARDTVRLGACVADGRAAGPAWTGWVLSEMRLVRGTGDFGIRRALPVTAARMVAIKNGWLLRAEDGQWHVACLAIGPDWVLSVLLRYPGARGLEYGANRCRSVGAQLLRV